MLSTSHTVLVVDHYTLRGVIAQVTDVSRKTFTVGSARLHNLRGKFSTVTGSAQEKSTEHGFRLRAHSCLYRPEIKIVGNAPSELVSIRRCAS